MAETLCRHSYTVSGIIAVIIIVYCEYDRNPDIDKRDIYFHPCIRDRLRWDSNSTYSAQHSKELGAAIKISSNTTLASYTRLGTYYVDSAATAATISDIPDPIGGTLFVKAANNSDVVFQAYQTSNTEYIRRIGKTDQSLTTSWVRIDNFGCNTLAELKAALANV